MLVCLMVSIHHSGKATLAEAWRLAAFCLSPTAREHLGLDADRPPANDPHACLADNRRFHRAFDRLTGLLDVARHDRRTRLPKNRLAHGRAAQTILVALLVTVANDHFLDQWRHTHQPPDKPDTSADIFQIPAERLDRSPLTGRSRPPPVP
ncbi:hypothetical protein [Streptosporangium sp. NBC_01469]|uniref:hypothetical protein n=1 Tax=Streptosporangium sp. NBC_01469 TaxID=2903898 RepID=UPI002E2CDCD0|nr:hypothetical protein [Streptosporangium sp. NBC_01469]